MGPEAVGQSCHLALKPAAGASDASRGEVDPGLDHGQLSTPLLGLLRTRKAPRLDNPGPVENQPGVMDALLGTAPELVPLGQVGRETLQRRSSLVQIVGSSSQGQNRADDGGPRGVGVRTPPTGKLTECIFQSQRVLAQL